MAGLMDRLRTMIGVEEELLDEDEYVEEVKERPVRQSRTGLADDTLSRERLWDTPPRTNRMNSDAPRERENVIVMPPKAHTSMTSQIKIVVIEPKSFDDCPKLVDSLKARKPVIINLEKIETETAKKIFFFLNGATCALGGNVQKIANNIFVFVPENVDIMTNGEHKSGFPFQSDDDNPWKS